MNPLIFLILSFAVGTAIFLLTRPKDRHPKPALQDRSPDRHRPEETSDDFEPVWESIEFFPGKSNRPSGFVGLAGKHDISLSGTNAPEARARDFLTSADPNTASITVKRDPNNPHDRNAIRIYGHTRPGASALPLGWIPAQVAADLNTEFSPEMPIAAEIRKGGVKRDGSACFIAVNLLAPAAKERKKFKVTN